MGVARVPASRVTVPGDRPLRSAGAYVLYWMVAARRTRWSYALQHARWHADRLGLPLVVFEPLALGHDWACDRFHRFVMDGMTDNAARCAAAGVRYVGYVEPARGAARGLLATLARDAALVVTDDVPLLPLRGLVPAAVSAVDARFEAVDGTGILPVRSPGRTFTAAVHFRRHLQKTLRPHLADRPAEDPLAGIDRPLATLPDLSAWPSADDLAALPIDHRVPPVPDRGGAVAGEGRLAAFLDHRLGRYDTDRNRLPDGAASGLSAHLHFGHVSAHEVVWAALDHDGWAPELLAEKATAKRHGWWGASTAVEAFLDEVITWRELGHVHAVQVEDPYAWEDLPAWARASLELHAVDPRPHLYTLDQLEAAETHDPIWNAAQRQLRVEGRIHNYLRMLWGKKVLEWSPHPRDALSRLVHLNDRWAVDGRDPNSAAGIGWVLGRFDRAWGPERPIFGKVRYMSSASTRRKLRVQPYLERWSDT